MSKQDEIKKDLVGDGGTGVSYPLVFGLMSVTKWPVDAFSVDLKDIHDQSVTWLHGESLGRLSAVGDFENPDVTVGIFPLRAIVKTTVAPRFQEIGNQGSVARTMTVELATGESITVDASKYVAGHYRDRADELITAVLNAIARHR